VDQSQDSVAQGDDNRSSDGNQSAVSAPTIALPKGGGAIRGIGEKFAANPVTGTGSMSVPIATSPGRSGFGPQLSLSYDSGSGNGPFGFGWNLSIPSITRKTDKGLPQYLDGHSGNQDSDVFILSGAEDLVPVCQKDETDEWVRDAQGNLVIQEDEIDGYRIRRYRPRIEGLFARIERWTNINDKGDVHWRSISKDNILTLYGKDSNSRIADDPENPKRIFSWLISETRDDKGNAVIYEYKPEDGSGVNLALPHECNRGDPNDQRRTANRYIKHIFYGNRTPFLDDAGQRPCFLTQEQLENEHWMFEVVFDYEDHNATDPKPRDDEEDATGTPPKCSWVYRKDPFSTYRAGFEVRTTRLCQRILMFHHFPDEAQVGNDCLVRSSDFNYTHELEPENARNPVYTFLQAVTQTGYQRDGAGYQKRELPPVEFEYTWPVVQDKVEEVDPASLENLPMGVDGAAYQWTDLHGEGIPGILTEQSDAWYYKRNLSPIGAQPVEFAPLEQVALKPNLALASGAQFMDLAGDGQPDLVVLDGPAPGLYEHDGKEGWQPFRPFTSRLHRDMRDPNLKFVDLDGDGHADVLITENDAFVWHASLAEAGFGPARRVAQTLDEEKGPRLVFADGTQTVYLADLSGDGLTDLVRIRNGEVCYWPNLGYGRFGAKVTMTHAPYFDHPDQFDHKRIRLADIDGTGTTDIIYLHRDGVRLYFNQSGNSWSEPQILRVFPHVDDLVSIVPTDLLGNGTACLVWSSPLSGDTRRPMRYVNLMGGQKPHLLVKTVNNLGAETHVQYAPSTQFYLQDKRDGKPWITRLPFPVHVVERVETIDWISKSRFSTHYAYHHGYFDGEEREFRGFGMVEQWDTEEYTAIEGNDNFLQYANIDKSSHMPPVHTKTWFHTGIYMGRNHVSNFFAGMLDLHDRGEYYREPAWRDDDDEAAKYLLKDTILPEGLTVEEAREACRSLKGAMLRQEVYAKDGTEKAEHPYTVTEQNFTIRQLQPRADNRHAVFFTHARETISYHYERNKNDPRMQHALTLEVDQFGNVLKEAAIGYGRRAGKSPLQGEDKDKQEQLLITYTENGFTRDDATHSLTNPELSPHNHRTPLLCETQTYEITGLKLEQEQLRFSFDQMLEGVQSAQRIDYHQTPSDSLQKRVVEHARTLYRRNDLTGALALGELQSLALPFERYQLAFTPEHLDLVFGDRINDAILSNEGRYVHSENDTNWWIPSGHIFLSPNERDDAAQELAFAQQHFFLPHRFRDPFSQTSFVTYDPYDLLLLDTRDPLGNRVTAGERDGDGSVSPRINYRVLQAELMTDPNGNRAAVAFDVLGLVAGTAVMGKVIENLGDSLDGFQAQLTQIQIDAFFADPRGPIAAELLGNASSRIIYDETRFQRLAQPPFAATIVRETHVSDLVSGEETAIQASLAYSDGFGRTIQNKVQAEPGPVEEGGPIVSPRWTTSGWTIFNNKGKPVKQYEPFFSPDHVFKFGVTVGVSPTLFYDPIGRVVATLHPNHTWEKVIFGPWRQETWDVNDTVLAADPAGDPDVGGYFDRLDDSEYLPTWDQLRISGGLGNMEQKAAEKTADHAETPAIIHFDSLGRPFLSIAHNGPDRQYQTRTEQDIEGNPLRIIDDRGNVVMAYQIAVNGSPPVPGVDVAGRQLFENSMDSGERRVLADIGGKPIRSWDSRGHILRSTYDELQRPTHRFVQRESEPELLAERTVYGEGHSEAASLNLRGQVYQVYDGAGVVTSRRIDFKGNLLVGSRQLAREYRTTMDWSVLAGLTEISEIEAAAVALLEVGIFTTQTDYDALNRPVAITTPDNSVTLPTYNEANLLEQMAVRLRGASQTTLFATNINYNAKGQRELISYATTDGTNFTTTYDYDPDTFRLTRLHTVRHRDNRALQDLNYTYDPVGNITSIQDNAQQTVFFDKTQIEPHCEYTYDALYRLIQAQGREHATQNNIQRDATDFVPVIGIPFANSPEALQRYVEAYAYDGVGNILSMAHTGGANLRWKRCYQYAQDSNRLLATGGAGEFKNAADPCPTNYILSPTLSQHYEYDTHGNMIQMPHLPLMQWDFKDQLVASSQQVNNNGTPEITYYVYDAGGQRVRKVTERQAAAGETPTRMKERLYLGGFEIYREYDGSDKICNLERETLHIMDDKQRIALVETKIFDAANMGDLNVTVIRYQLGNHLGSASLELDKDGAMISYEEYHPYGTTSFQAGRSQAEVSLKRYRYTGMERDEETGLNYHGARYYAGWLGVWVSSDPIKMAGGMNLYQFVNSNPVNRLDRNGLQDEVVGYHRTTRRIAGQLETHGFNPNISRRRTFLRGNWFLDTPNVPSNVKASGSTVVAQRISIEGMVDISGSESATYLRELGEGGPASRGIRDMARSATQDWKLNPGETRLQAYLESRLPPSARSAPVIRFRNQNGTYTYIARSQSAYRASRPHISGSINRGSFKLSKGGLFMLALSFGLTTYFIGSEVSAAEPGKRTEVATTRATEVAAEVGFYGLIYKAAELAKKGAGGLVALVVEVVQYPGCVQLKPLNKEEGITEEEAEARKAPQQLVTSGGVLNRSNLLGFTLLTQGLGLSGSAHMMNTLNLRF